MSLEYQVVAAFLLDLLIGDPRWLPHPVRFIGRLALGLEAVARRWISDAKVAGIVTAVLTIVLTGLITAGIVKAGSMLHPWGGDIVSVLLLYTTLATRDLMKHSMAVFDALGAGDLPAARQRVGMIVGRDTQELDEAGVTRATVESVAESTVDGVTAPLFFALLFGPVGAMMYKAVNTLDSTFGYKNERYLQFGWASARIDDVANWLPARLTVPVMVLASALLGLSAGGALRMTLRDGQKHASPNSGLAEAATAGALGVRLGGNNSYFGKIVEKPTIGDPVHVLAYGHILKVNLLMAVSAALFLAFGVALRVGM